MGSILVLDHQTYRRELLIAHLCESGHTAWGICSGEEFISGECSGYDLVIVNLYPDVHRSWQVYMALKQKSPDLPVLVYLDADFHSFRVFDQVLSSAVEERSIGASSRPPVWSKAHFKRSAGKQGPFRSEGMNPR